MYAYTYAPRNVSNQPTVKAVALMVLWPPIVVVVECVSMEVSRFDVFITWVFSRRPDAGPLYCKAKVLARTSSSNLLHILCARFDEPRTPSTTNRPESICFCFSSRRLRRWNLIGKSFNNLNLRLPWALCRCPNVGSLIGLESFWSFVMIFLSFS